MPVLLPFAVGLLGSNLDWSRTLSSGSWGHVLASLYYIPIVIAAISLGARPAVIVALAAGAANGAAGVFRRGEPWAQTIAQTMLFVCIGLTAAALAEWLRTGAVRTALRKGSLPDSPGKNPDEARDASQMSVLNRVVVGLVRQFRTPLTSIEGAGWLLEDSRLPDDKRQEFVGIVRKESHRLNRVLSDVLDFARPQQPRFRSIDLSTLVDEVIQLAGSKGHTPSVLFRKNIPPDIPPLECDPVQIRQVLLNLAMNSIQASTGGGEIEISAHLEDGNAVIKVKDQGRGIPPEVLDKIFDPFFTTRENSLGLGLPVALHIVSEHGGKIMVEPYSDKGACVAVVLPLVRPAHHQVGDSNVRE
jgi:signal transduction histidine kinase